MTKEQEIAKKMIELAVKDLKETWNDINIENVKTYPHKMDTPSKVCSLSSNDSAYLDKSKNDMVNHPHHYQIMPGVETLDIMNACCTGLNTYQTILNSNVIKYITRWNKKNGVEDLKKARFYLNLLIENQEILIESQEKEKK